MDSLKTLLTEILSNAFESCGYDSGYARVLDSQRPDLGQFQCNGALAAAKTINANPRDIALKIVGIIEKDKRLNNISIAGPGFINLSVNDDFLASHINEMAKDDQRAGCPVASTPRTIVIDFGGPNIAKPMHVGHLRSAIIGDCLQRLFRFYGENVISDNHMGDWGTQMGMLICELKKRRPELPYFDDKKKPPFPDSSPVSIAELEEIYPAASGLCKSSPDAMSDALKATTELQNGNPGYKALWEHFVRISVAELKNDFSTLGIHFDHWLGESRYQNLMKEMVGRLKREKHAAESEGAVIIPVRKEDDTKEVPPLMLVKSDGGLLYGTSDLATIEYRVENFHPDEILYVVDKRQSLHFEQVFRASRKTGISGEKLKLVHVGFGTVNGLDGKPFKTREGGVMKLKDLMTLVYSKALERMTEAGVAQGFGESEKNDVANKVGIAALKFADLANHRESNYIFDIDKFTQFEGKTGPYLLYTAVRIKSILRNAAEKSITGGEILPATDLEQPLMLYLCQFPEAVRSAMENYLPNYLCDFAYILAQEFNRFYQGCHILSEKDGSRQSSWLSLVSLVLLELKLVLGILGIEIPERM